MAKMYVLVIVISHWVGTIYHLTAQIETFYGYEDTWLHNLDIYHENPYKRYLESFYWAVATFLLIGSKGDTSIETIYCIIILFITIGLFAYILNSIG